MANKMIWVTFQKKGIHQFNGAKEVQFKDVNYLQYPHRHLFKFKVSIEVFHDDREIEFHQFLNYLESLYEESILSLNNSSCEMIADNLAKQICKKYSLKKRNFIIEVSEDGEVGCTANYNTQEFLND